MTLALALTLSMGMEPSFNEVLRGVYCVESSCGTDLRDGDRHRPICERSRGAYQVRPIAVRELVRVGLLDAGDIPGYSRTNCTGIRAWLAVPENNRKAGRLYLTLMLARSGGDIETALCRYNGPPTAPPGCIYAGQVLAIASGEGM